MGSDVAIRIPLFAYFVAVKKAAGIGLKIAVSTSLYSINWLE
jgi:hypothetical protein